MGFNIGGMFGDNSGGYDDYAAAMREIAAKYDPYIKRGDNAGNFLYDENQRLMQDPNYVQNMIAKGYETSPYQQMLQDDVTWQMNTNAANNGMVNSPLAQRALNDRVNGMTGQFMNDYIGRGMSSYGMGHQGMTNTENNGMGALNQASNYMQQGAGASLQGDISKNNMWNNVIGTGASIGLGVATGGASMGMPNWGRPQQQQQSPYRYRSYRDPSSGFTMELPNHIYEVE